MLLPRNYIYIYVNCSSVLQPHHVADVPEDWPIIPFFCLLDDDGFQLITTCTTYTIVIARERVIIMITGVTM